jgi:hypothetical protein
MAHLLDGQCYIRRCRLEDDKVRPLADIEGLKNIGEIHPNWIDSQKEVTAKINNEY